MLPGRSAKNIDLAAVFRGEENVAVQGNGGAQLVGIALTAVAQKKRVAGGVVGVVHAQGPAADHGSVGTGNTVRSSAGSAAAFVMEIESRVNDGHILAQTLGLAANAGVSRLLAIIVRVVNRIHFEGEIPGNWYLVKSPDSLKVGHVFRQRPWRNGERKSRRGEDRISPTSRAGVPRGDGISRGGPVAVDLCDRNIRFRLGKKPVRAR